MKRFIAALFLVLSTVAHADPEAFEGRWIFEQEERTVLLVIENGIGQIAQKYEQQLALDLRLTYTFDNTTTPKRIVLTVASTVYPENFIPAGSYADCIYEMRGEQLAMECGNLGETSSFPASFSSPAVFTRQAR